MDMIDPCNNCSHLMVFPLSCPTRQKSPHYPYSSLDCSILSQVSQHRVQMILRAVYMLLTFAHYSIETDLSIKAQAGGAGQDCRRGIGLCLED